MLRRFADPRLRAELDKTRDARDQARNTARRLFARLKASRHALETQAALTERWRGIARDAQDQLAVDRARSPWELTDEPGADVTRVYDAEGDMWIRSPEGWRLRTRNGDGDPWSSWQQIATLFGPMAARTQETHR